MWHNRVEIGTERKGEKDPTFEMEWKSVFDPKPEYHKKQKYWNME